MHENVGEAQMPDLRLADLAELLPCLTHSMRPTQVEPPFVDEGTDNPGGLPGRRREHAHAGLT